jgi:hypothetical protein
MGDARRFSDVTMKASHNTYDINWPLATMTSSGGWSFPVYEAGCRAVELDIGQYGGPDPGRQMQWSVQHGGDFVLHNRQLSQFLAELRGWSEATPDHDVVTIFMCLKGIVDRGPFPELLDRYIAQFLCGNDLDRLYRPADLLARSGAGDLREAARKKGWATLDALRGRFLVVMTGFHQSLAHYAASPKDRIGFACIDCTEDEKPPGFYIDGKPNQLFLNYHLFGDHRKAWVPAFKAARDDPSILFRGYLVQDGWWDVAADAGIHMLASDDVHHPWPEPFRLRPGGKAAAAAAPDDRV